MHITVEANLTMKYTNNPRAAFVLKNRMKTRYTIPIPNTGVQSEIIEGAKFHYSREHNKHKVWAKGPLYAEMVVMVNTTLPLQLNILFLMLSIVLADFAKK